MSLPLAILSMTLIGILLLIVAIVLGSTVGAILVAIIKFPAIIKKKLIS